MVMIRVNIAEAKVGLSRLLRAVRQGESVVICERNVPVAELRSLPSPAGAPRPLGPGRPGFTIPAAFFEPLPDEMQQAFEGRDA